MCKYHYNLPEEDNEGEQENEGNGDDSLLMCQKMKKKAVIELQDRGLQSGFQGGN